MLETGDNNQFLFRIDAFKIIEWKMCLTLAHINDIKEI